MSAERKRVLSLVNRDIANALVCEATYRENYAIGDCASNCTYADQRLAYVIGSLRKLRLWPHTHVEVRTLNQVWSALEDQKWADLKLVDMGIGTCSAANQCLGFGATRHDGGDLINIRMRLEECLDQTREAVRCLCLDCVRQGSYLEASCEHSEEW